jgi:inosine/xanthosine triphosphatase
MAGRKSDHGTERKTGITYMHVLVCSQNPVKVKAAKMAFSKFFPSCKVEGKKVPSGVSKQPMSEKETIKGAKKRIKNGKKLFPKADFWVGMEGGVEKIGERYYTFAWMCIEDKKGMQGLGRTASLPLPQKAVLLLREGKELGEAMDKIFSQKMSKHKGGASGLLSGGVLMRKNLYFQGMVCALIPFVQKKLFS